MHIDKEVLKVQEFAEFLGISPKVAYDLVHSKGFPAFRPSPGSIRVMKKEALKWLNQNCKI